MKIISAPTNKSIILAEYNRFFKTMIKAVVDIDKEVMALDAELHADLEAVLVGEGSRQENLWGINLYLGKPREEWIEYTALVNIRPSMDNRGMEVENPDIRKRLQEVVGKLITE